MMVKILLRYSPICVYTYNNLKDHSWHMKSAFLLVILGHTATNYDTLSDWIFGDNWNVDGVPLTFYDQSVPKDDPIHNAPNAEALRRAIFERIV